MFGVLGKLLAGPIIEQVGGLAGRFFGSKEKRDDQAASQTEKAQEQYAAEFQDRSNRTWFDSLVDGLNRLPRPLAFGYCATMLTWPLYDPEGFAKAMNAYILFPEWLVQLIFGVLGFYFGGRILTKDLKMGGPSTKVVSQMLENQKALTEAFASREPQEATGEVLTSQPVVAGDPYEEVPGRLSNAQFEAQMKGEGSMSLPAIVEWNRRRKEEK